MALRIPNKDALAARQNEADRFVVPGAKARFPRDEISDRWIHVPSPASRTPDAVRRSISRCVARPLALGLSACPRSAHRRRSESWSADVANAQTRGHQRVAGASRGHPLRILWRFQEPNGIAHQVADSRTDRRRHMLQGSRICRRSDRSQRCCYPCQALSRARELAGGRWKSIVDRGRSKNGATASNLAAASQTTRPGLSTFWPSCCLSSTAESFCASHK